MRDGKIFLVVVGSAFATLRFVPARSSSATGYAEPLHLLFVDGAVCESVTIGEPETMCALQGVKELGLLHDVWQAGRRHDFHRQFVACSCAENRVLHVRSR